MWECFREALDPNITKVYVGYCTRAEDPFLVMVPKEYADGDTCPHCGAPRVAHASPVARAERR
ncbi:MAG TPA: hypothetical protein VEM93_08425 [Actinomycetota bacterium]|nr:hypothetical protein [Actinomycetota bacterium]